MNATQKVILLVLGVMCVATVTAVVIYQYLEQREQPAVMIQPLEVDEPWPNEIPVNASAALEAPSSTDEPVALDAPDEPDGHWETSLNATDDEPTAIEQNAPATERIIRVATWNPLDIETPEWIYPAIKDPGVRGHFRQYNGNYKLYTTELIREIKRVYPDDQPATLVLLGWINVRNVRGGRPEGIDPYGLLTFIDDRTDAGLPGIWPDAGLDFWRKANDHLFRELRAADIDVDLIALDTEVSPHGLVGAFKFEGTHEAIINDPRWHEKPLLGFGGLTAGDIWPDPSPEPYRQLWEFNRMVGQHAFATAVNEVLTARLLAHYPDAMISDYRWHSKWWDVNMDMRRERKLAVARVIHALEQDRRWLQSGVGNIASPAFYGHGAYRGLTDADDQPISAVDAMLDHARELADLYGSPTRVIPWITTRQRMDANIREEKITEEKYRDWIRSLVDLGIEHFLLFNTSRDSTREQAITVQALLDAVEVGD